MANEIALFQGAGLPADMSKIEEGLNQIANRPESGGSNLDGRDLLKLTKQGEWVFGINSEPLADDDRIVINPASLQRGFIAWGEDGILGEVMKSVFEGAVDKSTLEDYPEDECENGWQEQLQFDCQIYSDGEVGEDLLRYKQTSVSGLRFVQQIVKEMTQRFAVDKEYFIPVVALSHDSYEHKVKKFGTIITPEGKIEGWMNAKGELAKDGPAQVAEEGEAAATEEAPRRRRRRASS